MTLISVDTSLNSQLVLNSGDPPLKSFALASLLALLAASVVSADEPNTRSAASAETPKSDNQSERLDGPIAKQYAAILGRV